jgi:hypothetical protein
VPFESPEIRRRCHSEASDSSSRDHTTPNRPTAAGEDQHSASRAGAPRDRVAAFHFRTVPRPAIAELRMTPLDHTSERPATTKLRRYEHTRFNMPRFLDFTSSRAR